MLLQRDPGLFDAYHEGFRAQAEAWTKNPLDLALEWIRSNNNVRVVADFGCGDAQIGRQLRTSHTVHSFDLVARNNLVTACTMSEVPCTSGVDPHFLKSIVCGLGCGVACVVGLFLNNFGCLLSHGCTVGEFTPTVTGLPWQFVAGVSQEMNRLLLLNEQPRCWHMAVPSSLFSSASLKLCGSDLSGRSSFFFFC